MFTTAAGIHGGGQENNSQGKNKQTQASDHIQRIRSSYGQSCSKKSAQRAGKLVYQSKGLFIIVKDTGHSNLVRRYDKTNSSLRKYMTQDLYILPPNFPCKHLDTPNVMYLNSDFAPKNRPFANTLDIASYNT